MDPRDFSIPPRVGSRARARESSVFRPKDETARFEQTEIIAADVARPRQVRDVIFSRDRLSAMIDAHNICSPCQTAPDSRYRRCLISRELDGYRKSRNVR